LGLSACLSQTAQLEQPAVIVNRSQKYAPAIGVIVFGSDQGLVGQFNEVMVEFVVDSLARLSGNKMVWAVGERVESRLLDTDLKTEASFELPHSINTITGLVGEILIELEAKRDQGLIDQVFLFHHKLEDNSISRPVSQQLLPLDAAWQRELVAIDWPSNNLVEVMPDQDQTRRAFVREYLFVSLFRACAESLASENASRLAAMQRAEKNIDEIQENLNQTFHRLRQSDIDEELSDVLSGFNALN
jgi:F-type H+-transporting ATPase subunit gamma